jgi:hypothetical protein
MLGGFTRSLSALVHFTLHTGAGVDSVVYKIMHVHVLAARDTRMGQLAGARARAAMHFSLRGPHNMI